MSIELTISSQSKCQLPICGSVENVLAGIMPEDDKNHWIDASLYAYGFMMGSPHGVDSVGEMILIDGTCYVQSTKHHKLIFGKQFLSSAALLIPKDLDPPASCHYEGHDLPLSSFYQWLYDQLGGPFALAGTLTCADFEGAAIEVPPVHGLPLLEHKETYYPNPPLRDSNITAQVVGIVATHEEAWPEVFYANPFENPHDISSHTHALTDAVRHLFPRTTITKADLKIYPVGALQPINRLE